MHHLYLINKHRLLRKCLLSCVITFVALSSLYPSSVALALTSSNQSNNINPTPVVIQGENDSLIVGSEQDFPPFSTGLTDATTGGFTVELWRAVAAESGLKYSFRVLPFHKLLDEFKAGKIDVLINLNITDELHAYADFSVPHAIIQGGIFVRKDESNIHSLTDLAGKSIIMMAADIENKYADSHGLRKQIVLVNNVEEGLRLLSSGKHDAMLVGKLVGLQTLEKLALNNIKVLKADAEFSQKFAIAVRKGQADLLGKINEGLALSKAGGSYDALYEKWFGIYEPKALDWRDILKYLSPFLFLFLCLAQYAIYRRNLERNAAQQALQESEAHLRLSQISGGIGTWEADLLNHTQKWSENCTALLGLTATTNPTWDDFIALIHPEDRQYVINATQSHIEHGTPYDAEYRIMTPAGKCRWIRSTGQVERDVTGKPIFMRGIAQDIHLRKLVEQALQKSEHTLSEVLENVDSYIYLKDVQGRYLYANAKVCALFNTTLDAIVGHGDEQFFDAEATEKIRLNDRQVLIEGKTVRAEETNLTTKNGAPTTYLVVKLPLRNDAGEIYGLCGISTEINDIKLMEIQLLKNNSLLQSTLESTNDAILVVDLNNTWILHNQRFIDLWGIADDIMDAKDDNAALSSVLEKLVDANAFLNKVHELYATPEVSSFDTLKFKNGKIVERYSIPQLNDSKVVGRVWSFRDVTERKLAEEKLIKSESFSHAIIEASPVPFALNDADGNITYLNKAFVKTFGYNLSDIPTLSEWWSLAYPNPAYHRRITDHWQKNLEEAQRTKTLFQPLEMNIQCKNGLVRTTICSATDVEGDFTGTQLVLFVDITEQKLAENALRIAAIAFESQEGMLVTDANNVILKVNQAFSTITGYSAEEAIGQRPSLLNSGKHDADFYKAMWKSINDKGTWQGDIWNKRKNGEVYPEQLCITAVKDNQGIITNYVATLTDITMNKAAAEEIQRLAFYDPLTQLPNRRLLLDRLTKAIVSSARNGIGGAVLFVDLDHFKTLNDSFGHDIGDLMLQQVAERLSSCVREGDTVARLGGDEYVIMLEHLSNLPIEAAAQAEGVAKKILTALNKPFKLATHEHQNTASVGIALFNDQNQSQEDLLKHADIAMYQAKKSGRNALCFFDPIMQDAISTRVSLESDLRNALKNKEFQLYYQVQVNGAGQALGAEALIRWLHPTRGVVLPNHFIPLAEETGLILPIGQWVLETACAQLKAWKNNPLTCDLTLSINVSAKQFNQSDFVKHVKATIKRYKINPSSLNFELTESIIIENMEYIIITMMALQAIGIHFELDDFGTGYSSLQYLKKLPLYQLKIDQSFVRDLVEGNSDQAIVRTIIAMAHSLNLEVIAEGVETERQLANLTKNRCNRFQGYLFGKPVPIELFNASLK